MTTDDSWSMLVLTCSRAWSELVSDALWSLGVVAIEERRLGEDVVELWTSVGGDPSEVEDWLVDVEHVIAARRENVSRSVADAWRDFAEPVVVSDELRIVPTWLSVDPSARDLRIDPVDTFGLGNHPTTLGALRLLFSLDCHAPTLLDVGTGSGILAIAMAKFRDARCMATDISTSSRAAVCANSETNGVNVEYVDHVDEVSGEFDIVAANILAPVLRELSEVIVSKTREGGTVVLAGMRENQVQSVLEIYGDCVIAESVTIDGWVAVALRRIRPTAK